MEIVAWTVIGILIISVSIMLILSIIIVLAILKDIIKTKN